ncbi:NAD-dependent succinate-semialdehyde dehydrogenase [Myroides phaeus]|uniref:Succinate-semialdehyde dehydrogenase / glutarate-semialdehyde dehydrogenase n=1 Tax=Myroides phaeus TaxID=702745 RepID=A0A1G8FKN8_9FLAO|nr:NAD-dependent succinate-semialdehyde dehydrogenase [Myroides phaeus]MEC4116716.1 NAD-dependent succinate-semialdehyde dehydrogenase [Myroides phaeus]SDH82667.1 succinate-semialdehyde dehydrogenase / glutarate-semialdehyde dehydrogenase [Myroides phaeus]
MSTQNKSNIKTINPTTGKEEKVFDVMSATEIDQILTKADAAFDGWKRTSISERAKIIHKVAETFRARKEELGALITREMGKLLKEGIGEVLLCADIFDFYATNAASLLADEKIETPFGEAFISKEPIGVILSVQPWNFPFYQITRSAGPNLMAGNTMVLKHASNIPQCAQIMEDIFIECGLPVNVYTNLFVPGSQIEKIIADPRVKGVAFTGSEFAGASVAEAAGRHIKKTTLELGGSDAFIVLEDADVKKAIRGAVEGRLWNAGQVCVSPKRLIVNKNVADEFIAGVVEAVKAAKIGDPLEADTQVAPLSSERAREDVLGQVQKAVEQGVTLVHGGKKLDRDGWFMEPAILTGITKEMDIYSQEVFGPVFMIYVVENDAEAIALANDTPYGLGGSVFTENKEHGIAVAREIVTGMVYINHVTGIAPELPFGGTKLSGYGREQAKYGIHEFVNEKLIRVTDIDNAY